MNKKLKQDAIEFLKNPIIDKPCEYKLYEKRMIYFFEKYEIHGLYTNAKSTYKKIKEDVEKIEQAENIVISEGDKLFMIDKVINSDHYGSIVIEKKTGKYHYSTIACHSLAKTAIRKTTLETYSSIEELVFIPEDEFIEMEKLKEKNVFYHELFILEAIANTINIAQLDIHIDIDYFWNKYVCKNMSSTSKSYNYIRKIKNGQNFMSSMYSGVNLIAKGFNGNEEEYFEKNKKGRVLKIETITDTIHGVVYCKDLDFVVKNDKTVGVKDGYVGKIVVDSPVDYKKTYNLVKGVLGEEIDELYISDVQDTYVFYHNGKAISLPFDLRESMDSCLVRNQISIAKGYSNGFYDINRELVKFIDKYSVVKTTTVANFKKYCEYNSLNYDYFEATNPQRDCARGLVFDFKYVGEKVIKIYDTLDFYEKGEVSATSFRSACIRNGWNVNDFEIIPTSQGTHRCIKRQPQSRIVVSMDVVDYSTYEKTLFGGDRSFNKFKPICDENGWDFGNFEFIRQDTNPLVDNMISLQSGFYIHKDRLDETKRMELEIQRLRCIEEKYKKLFEIFCEN